MHRTFVLLLTATLIGGCDESSGTSDANATDAAHEDATLDARAMQDTGAQDAGGDASDGDGSVGDAMLRDAGVDANDASDEGCPEGSVQNAGTCSPAATSFLFSVGTLAPVFDPTVLAYTIAVDLDVTETSLTLGLPEGTTAEWNGIPIAAGSPFLIDALEIGDNAFSLVLHAPGQSDTTYAILIRRLHIEAQIETSGQKITASGDTLAQGDYTVSSNAGEVRVYSFEGGSWNHEDTLVASNAGSADRFGSEFAVDGDTIVVGARYEDSDAVGVGGNESSNAAVDSGAAYVFVRQGTVWTQQAYLKASNAEAGDQFGAYVAISGDTIAVGACGEESDATGVNGDQSNNDAHPGAVYVFTRSGTAWAQQAYVKPENAYDSSQFCHVALSGDTLAVGGSDYGNDGLVHVFVRSSSVWSQQALVDEPVGEGDFFFGEVLALSGDTLAVGSFGAHGHYGQVDVYERNGTTWSDATILTVSGLSDEPDVGASVALDGDKILAGSTGLPYLFQRIGATWSGPVALNPHPPFAPIAGVRGVAIAGNRLFAAGTEIYVFR